MSSAIRSASWCRASFADEKPAMKFFGGPAPGLGQSVPHHRRRVARGVLAVVNKPRAARVAVGAHHHQQQQQHQQQRLRRCYKNKPSAHLPTRGGGRVDTFVRAHREPSYDIGSYDPEMDGYVPPEVSLASLKKGAKVGEGSFGVVYRATVQSDDGETPPRDVIIKEYKKDVRGRDWESFYYDELAICRRLASCPGVAPFIGVAGADAYLVWENIGEVTLGSCVDDAAGNSGGGGGGCGALKSAAAAMRVEGNSSGDDDDVAKFVAVARALCQAAMAMHAEGVIHRDVKPDNILLTSPAEGSPGGGVVLVDLGGAADFETGQGCSGDEAIFDPTYGAPEQYTTEKKAAGGGGGGGGGSGGGLFGGLFGGGGGRVGKGDGLTATGAVPTEKFDAFGVGISLLRLAVPALHPRGAMERARTSMNSAAERIEEGTAEYDSVLDEWAASPGSGSCDFGLLDKADAWSLLEGLTQWDPEKRMTLKEAMDHPALN